MKVLVLKEKHGDFYYAVPANKEGVVMLHVVKDRAAQGWYDGSVDDKEKELLRRCVEKGDANAAVGFFHLRRDAEYEGWELISPTVLDEAPLNEWRLKHREELLQLIAAGLNKHEERRLANLEVVFYEDGESVMKRDVQTALDYLANDIYFDEENDWSNANIAEVRVL